MKAIRTKYVGPTDTKGARIVASDGDGNRVTIPYPHEYDALRAHREAAWAFIDPQSWKYPRKLISGWLRGAEYVHVMEYRHED